MHFVDREFVCERLKISPWSSYRILRPTNIHYISTDEVIACLNKSAKREDRLDYIPSDLVTAEDMEKETGIPARKLMLWTRRRRKVIPHFRITKAITRFRKSTTLQWLKDNG